MISGIIKVEASVISLQKGFETSVSEDEEKPDIVRVVWAVQSFHLSTQFSHSLAKDAHCVLRTV